MKREKMREFMETIVQFADEEKKKVDNREKLAVV